MAFPDSTGVADPELGEEQRQLLAMVRQFAAERLAPRAATDEASGTFPRELFDELGRLDLTGLAFPADAGGGGQPYGVYVRVLEELARAHAVMALTVSVHTLSTWAVATYGTQALRERVLGDMVAGRWLGAYCLSEPDSGSDAASLTARAERDGDEWVLDGTKAWVTHAGCAQAYVVFARTSADRTGGISAFLVPATTPGLTFPPPERKMGMHASPTGQVLLAGVRVPADHLLGEEGQGLKIALAALDGGRVGVAAIAVGLAQCALDHCVEHAGVREQFGQPIGAFQGLRFMLADMATGIEAARALYREAARRRDAGLPRTTIAAMAKMLATDTAMKVTTDAVQVFGGYGYTTEYPVERLMRETKVMQIFEGTNQIQRVVVSRALLGP